MEILKGLQVLNATKRRGMSDGPAGVQTSQIVQINIPMHVSQKFVTNTHNQIVEIHDDEGSRSLVTATPQAVATLAATRVNSQPALAAESGWQASATSADILAAASAQLSEPCVSETISKGLRRSFETKGAITCDDL